MILKYKIPYSTINCFDKSPNASILLSWHVRKDFKEKCHANQKKAATKHLNAVKTSEIDSTKINNSGTIKVNQEKSAHVAFDLVPKDAEYYIDDNKSDSKEFEKISPDDISELKIDKSYNQVKIIVKTKKSGQQTKEK